MLGLLLVSVFVVLCFRCVDLDHLGNLQFAKYRITRNGWKVIFRQNNDHIFNFPGEVWTQVLSSSTPERECFDLRDRSFSPSDNESAYDAENGIFKKKVIRMSEWRSDGVTPRTNCEEWKAYFLNQWGRMSSIYFWFEKARWSLLVRLGSVDPGGWFRLWYLGADINPERSNWFRKMGVVHLCNATGIHLAALALWIQFVFAWLGRRVYSGGASQGVGQGYWCSAGVFLILWGLQGFVPGMLRASLLLLLRYFADRRSQKWRFAVPLIWAIVLERAWAWMKQPSQVLEVGFGAAELGAFFYFLCVFGGYLSASYSRGPLRSHFELSIGSWVLAAVWECLIHGTMATLTPILSFLTLPLLVCWLYPAGLFLMGLDFFGTPLGADLAVFWSRFCDHVFDWILRFSLAAPQMVLVSSFSVLTFLLISALTLRLSTFRFLGVLACVGFAPYIVRFLLAAESSSNHVVHLEQLDVGQGDSLLVRFFDAQSLLVDVGPSAQMKSSVWFDLLAHRGLMAVDRVLLTHLDEDHAGGLENLLRVARIDQVVTSASHWQSGRGVALKDSIRAIAPTVSANGAEIRIGPIEKEGSNSPVQWLIPSGRLKKRKRAKSSSLGNAEMTGVRIDLPDGDCYLGMGDADSDSESWLRSQAGLCKGRWILKASHHGSRFSSSHALLSELKPREVWISSGVGNRYGHPSIQVLRELSGLEIPIHRTDQEGVISWKGGRYDLNH